MTGKNNPVEELKLLSGVPRFDVEVSLKCNINCQMCPREKITRPRCIMSQRVMDVLADWLPEKESEIFFCGLGEPLLNRNIYGLITALQMGGRRVGITSNGLLLTPGTANRLIDAGLDFVHVSLPSLNKERYQRMMKGSSFETVLTHLKYLAAIKPHSLSVDLVFVEQSENAADLPAVNALAKEMGFGFQHNVLHSRAGHLRTGRGVGGESLAPGGYRGCAIFARNHFITCEGDILACCHDLEGKTVLGNIENISFPDLLEIKKSRIQNHRWFEICSRCNDLNRY